jgi:hypothetical protein
LGSDIADSRIAPSLGSNPSMVALTRQGRSFTGGSRFSSIILLVLVYDYLRLFDYPNEGYANRGKP